MKTIIAKGSCRQQIRRGEIQRPLEQGGCHANKRERDKDKYPQSSPNEEDTNKRTRMRIHQKKDEHENHQSNLDQEDINKRMNIKTIRTLGFER